MSLRTASEKNDGHLVLMYSNHIDNRVGNGEEQVDVVFSINTITDVFLSPFRKGPVVTVLNKIDTIPYPRKIGLKAGWPLPFETVSLCIKQADYKF